MPLHHRPEKTGTKAAIRQRVAANNARLSSYPTASARNPRTEQRLITPGNAFEEEEPKTSPFSPGLLLLETASGEGKLAENQNHGAPQGNPEAIPQSIKCARCALSALCASAKRRVFFYDCRKVFLTPSICSRANWPGRIAAKSKGVRRRNRVTLTSPSSAASCNSGVLGQERGPVGGRSFSLRVS